MFEFFFRLFFEWLPMVIIKFWWIVIPGIIIIGIKIRKKKTKKYWREYWEEEQKWKKEQENK